MRIKKLIKAFQFSDFPKGKKPFGGAAKVSRNAAARCFLLFFVFAFSAFAQTSVASLEDAKAMGYPDGRKIVRDAGGNLFVAYRKKLGSAYQIYVSKSADGGATWTVANNNQPISTVAGACNQRVPSMAIDSNNTLHVVWYGLDANCASSASNERQIKYSRSIDGGATWTAWRDIAFVAGYTDTYDDGGGQTVAQEYWQEHPVIYIDADDKIFVVWEGRDANHYRVGQAKFIVSANRGDSWTAWRNVSETAQNQARPTIAVDSRGKIFVFAYSKLATANAINIGYATSTDSGNSFSAWSPVSASDFDQRHASAAIDSGNRIHLVWRQEDVSTAGKTVVKYAKFTSPNWSAPETISAAPGFYQFFPSISNVNDAQFFRCRFLRGKCPQEIANRVGSLYVVWTETTDESGYVSASGSEEPTTGKIVFAKKLQGASAWTKTDATAYANNVWGSLRWSSNRVNGGTIDLVYSSGAMSPYSLQYKSLGIW